MWQQKDRMQGVKKSSEPKNPRTAPSSLIGCVGLRRSVGSYIRTLNPAECSPMRTGSTASTKIIGIAELVCLTASAAFPPVTMTSTLAGRTLTRLLRIVRCVLLPSVSISARHALTASLRARSAARAGGRPRLCHPRGRRHRHRYDARSGRQAIPGVLPGRCFHHPQIRRHRSWARDQQTLLPDDGRRHYGRERA